MNGSICYRTSSVERIVRCKVTSTTSNGTAPTMSCIWNTVPSPKGQDAGRSRTYIRSGEVLRHGAYELEYGL